MKITPEMIQAGYVEVAKLAHQNGYGWSFGLVSEKTVDAALVQVFQAMIAAAPQNRATKLYRAIKARLK